MGSVETSYGHGATCNVQPRRMKNEKNEKEKGMKEFERYRYKIRVKVHVASKKFSLFYT